MQVPGACQHRIGVRCQIRAPAVTRARLLLPYLGPCASSVLRQARVSWRFFLVTVNKVAWGPLAGRAGERSFVAE